MIHSVQTRHRGPRQPAAQCQPRRIRWVVSSWLLSVVALHLRCHRPDQAGQNAAESRLVAAPLPISTQTIFSERRAHPHDKRSRLLFWKLFGLS